MSRHKKITILACVLTLTLNIVACGQVKGESDIKPQESGIQTDEHADTEAKADETAGADKPVVDQQESSAQTVDSINPETFPLGEYQDDMGSQLIISEGDDKNYSVTYSIYKLMYMDNAAGSYDADLGILSFSGTDDVGAALSADVAIEGDHLIVTLTQSAYPDCPAGTTYRFEPCESSS